MNGAVSNRLELPLLAVVLAAALQIQATIPVGDAGIRVALSDLFLPIACIYVAIWVIRSPVRLSWRMPGVIWWLAAITVALTIALFVGRERIGALSSWALINKYLGWYILIAYFVVGTAFVRFGDEALRNWFLGIFVSVAAGVAAVNLLAMPWLQLYYTLPYGVEFGRATGAMKNSNAFGFLLTVAALLTIARGNRLMVLLPPLIGALWFSGSRGACLSFVFGGVGLAIMARSVLVPIWKPVGVAVLAIVVITAVSIAVNPKILAQIQSGTSYIGLLSADRLDPNSKTIVEREVQNAQALELIADAPLFGQGLGAFVAKTGVTLHNSLLWLLLETGLAGTVAVAGFLFTAIWYIYQGRGDPFLLGMVGVAAAFMVVSVTGEFLYQRHLWFLLGMALASAPRGDRQA